MPIGISNEQGAIIRGADGTLLYLGAAVIGQTVQIINNDTTKMAAGEAARADLTNFFVDLPRDVGSETVASTQGPTTLKCLRASGASDTGWIGVCGQPLGFTPTTGIAYGQSGTVLGMGSICGVQTTTAALTAGNMVGGAASGLVAVSAGTAGSAIVLGSVIKINTSGATGTGSTSWAGIMVCPI